MGLLAYSSLFKFLVVNKNRWRVQIAPRERIFLWRVQIAPRERACPAFTGILGTTVVILNPLQWKRLAIFFDFLVRPYKNVSIPSNNRGPHEFYRVVGRTAGFKKPVGRENGDR